MLNVNGNTWETVDNYPVKGTDKSTIFHAGYFYVFGGRSDAKNKIYSIAELYVYFRFYFNNKVN